MLYVAFAFTHIWKVHHSLQNVQMFISCWSHPRWFDNALCSFHIHSYLRTTQLITKRTNVHLISCWSHPRWFIHIMIMLCVAFAFSHLWKLHHSLQNMQMFISSHVDVVMLSLFNSTFFFYLFPTSQKIWVGNAHCVLYYYSSYLFSHIYHCFSDVKVIHISSFWRKCTWTQISWCPWNPCYFIHLFICFVMCCVLNIWEKCLSFFVVLCTNLMRCTSVWSLMQHKEDAKNSYLLPFMVWTFKKFSCVLIELLFILLWFSNE